VTGKKKLLDTFHHSLKKLKYYNDAKEIIDIFSHAYDREDKLSTFNIILNTRIAELLGIKCKFELGTNLGLGSYKKNDRLIRRCAILDSKTYLCGQGASGYQDDGLLISHGIEIIKADYALGNRLFGDDVRYSILYNVAKYGCEYIKAGIEEGIKV
jgi:hypothetical protein